MPLTRVNPPYVADELTMLRSYLDYQRETFRWKTGGLTQDQMGQSLSSSTLTLAGLVKHLALVEDWWFGENLVGTPAMTPFTDIDFVVDPEWEFRTALDDTPDFLADLLARAIAASDANITAAGDVDVIAARRHRKTGKGLSLRWILLHMIEEYARHNGHVDLIREAVDGLAGE